MRAEVGASWARSGGRPGRRAAGARKMTREEEGRRAGRWTQVEDRPDYLTRRRRRRGGQRFQRRGRTLHCCRCRCS